VASVQNRYCLINRAVDNALDETCHRLNVACWPIRRWASAC
jgi:aryl-alcohol dehydrogenase-like predicted oxidoreductase